ncbi:transcription factor UPBEAT1 [Cucumis sativus]|uniref:BHLH domain-containing protein n=1 Tax=Cucumis sativus TaxID=3659 RepID=A0A0A0K6D9_CUCSA|nr:transcription factor UPBEAT1 [Cucumis sativus]KGN45028.1 hypothetical protein Csa_016025 [Cucumis sativus]
MGVSQETLLQIQLNMEDHQTTQDRIIDIKEIRNNNSNDQSTWKKNSMKEEEVQEINSKGKDDKSTCNINTRRTTRRRSRSNSLILKKRSRRSSSSSSSRIEQRVNTLRSLVPNNDNHNHDDQDESCVGSLEQLFTQTADYILSLQTRVRLMKTLVDVLSDPSSSIDE